MPDWLFHLIILYFVTASTDTALYCLPVNVDSYGITGIQLVLRLCS